MSQDISQPLRATLQLLESFIAHGRVEVKARKNGQHDLSSLTEHGEHLLADLQACRRPALLAGVKAGWPAPSMSALLEDCQNCCIQYHRGIEENLVAVPATGVFTEDALEVAYARLVACLSPRLHTLEDLVELGREAEQPTAQSLRETSSRVQAPEPQQPVTAGKPAGEVQTEAGLDKETLAIAALLTIGPNVSRIAIAVGVPRTTLLGWQQFREQLAKVRAASEREKQSRRRSGYKSDDGTFDAWQEDK